MRLLQLLRIPAAFIAANWAGLLGIVSLVGAVPSLAGTQKVMSSLEEHADTSGMVVVRHILRTLRRDLPATVALWVYVVLAISTTALLALVFDAPERVFFAGLGAPVYLVTGVFLTAYVRAAALLPTGASRTEVVQASIALLTRHPLRALGAALLVPATAPVWVLAPLTIACGVSLPAWAVDAVWTGVGRSRSPQLAILAA